MSLAVSPATSASVSLAPSPAPAEAEATASGAPRFIVGQDPRGQWVAVEVHGWAGGLFRTRHDALHYAVDATGRRPDAVAVSTDRIELRL